VKVTMSRLRRKLGDPPLIETLPQAGYRIEP
jgi:DNA-binding response OmpR family regulator